MNLLKVFIIVVMTASISLLLSSKLQAVDHPWDDNKGDTTTIVGSTPDIGNEPRPIFVTSITSRILAWTRIFFLEIKSVLLGVEKNDISVRPPAGNTRKSNSPFDSRK